MCDTVVALGPATADGAVIFGKNSDREPNEAQYLLAVPRTRHEPGSTVRCTYVELPQVEETYAVLLSVPFWMWGAEMGANEHGVAIGNQAVFTKVPYEKDGLIGMDFIRLALERSRTAREALGTITTLLEAHGQGGNCGFTHPFYYHNSFILADPTEAWVLETAGRQWAAEQVRDVRTISNGLTIGAEWDLASDDLVRYAVEKGWCKGRDDFHFARCYSDFLYTTFGRANARQCYTTDKLSARKGQITVQSVVRALREHGPDSANKPGWTPARGVAGRQICQHAGAGPVRGDQATASMVSHLTPGIQTHFVTGTSAPCTGIFKPVWVDAALPDTGAAPAGTYDGATLFWQHEVLHRATLRDYARRINLYSGERDALEEQFIAGALACRSDTAEARGAFSAECFRQAGEAEAEWLGRVAAAAGPARMGPFYAEAWRKFNAEAGMPELP